MSWTLYEVWADDNGHEELIDTTYSEPEAIQMAKDAVEAGADYAIIYREDKEGELIELMRFPGP